MSVRSASASAFEADANPTDKEVEVMEARSLEPEDLRTGFDIISIELDAARREVRLGNPAGVHRFFDAIALHMHTLRPLLPPASEDPVRVAEMRVLETLGAHLGLPR